MAHRFICDVGSARSGGAMGMKARWQTGAGITLKPCFWWWKSCQCSYLCVCAWEVREHPTSKYDGTSATWLIGCTTVIHCKVTLYNISISMLNLSLKWRSCIRRWEHENAHDTCDAFQRRSAYVRWSYRLYHGKNSHRMIDTRWIYHQGMRR